MSASNEETALALIFPTISGTSRVHRLQGKKEKPLYGQRLVCMLVLPLVSFPPKPRPPGLSSTLFMNAPCEEDFVPSDLPFCIFFSPVHPLLLLLLL